jgi:hypothetical protein
MSSAYNCDDSSLIGIKQKGMLSAYKEKKKIICTEHTFLQQTSLEQILNKAARDKGLRFRQEVDESLIQDVDIPIYSYEGIDVMEVNLHSRKNNKVISGRRTFFIGALTIQMIYLNIKSPDIVDQKIRKQIFKFILNVNNKHCDPPLTKSEVINSFNANFKKYQSGEMNFAPYLIKQHAFWSKHSNLKGNEKRKVTCRIKNEPIVEESKKRIYEAIEMLMEGRDKITQVKVEQLSGLSIATVKKYWREFKGIVKDHNNEITVKHKPESKTLPETQQGEDQLPTENKTPIRESNEIIVPDKKSDIMNIEKIDCDEGVYLLGEEFSATKAIINPQKIFVRVFSISIERRDENQQNKLFEIFKEHLKTFKESDVKVLSMDIDDIEDSTTFFKQSNIESQLRDSVMKEFQKIIGE